MNKRILSIFLVILIVVGMVAVPASAQRNELTAENDTTLASVLMEGTCGENLAYFLDSDYELTIWGTGRMYDWNESYEVPWRPYMSKISRVIIEDDVESIGRYAFYGAFGVMNVHLPESLVAIGDYAFCRAYNLSEVAFPKNFEHIGYGAFDNCSGLKRIILYNNIQAIEENAFASCFKLSEVGFCGYEEEWSNIYIGGGNECILNSEIHFELSDNHEEPEWIDSGWCGEYLKWDLQSDGTLYISGDRYGEMDSWSNEADVPWHMYSGCSCVEEPSDVVIRNVVIGEEAETIGMYAFSGCEYLENVTIGDNVKFIEDYAFCNCKSLCELSLPDSVENIESHSLKNCVNLTDFYVGAGTTVVPPTLFTGCTSLSHIIVSPENQNWSSDEHGVLFDKEQKVLVFYPVANENTEYYITEGVKEIKSNAFLNCKNLVNVYIPDSVMVIGSSTFKGCTSLKEATIPGNVKTIPNVMFMGCTALEKVTINSGIIRVALNSFSECTSLTEITIPKTMTYIMSKAFYDCNNLSKVYYEGTAEEWDLISISAGNESLQNASIEFGGNNSSPDIVCEVTFDNKFSEPVTTEYIYGDMLNTLKDPPYVEGYIFEGWFCNGERVYVDTVVEGDMYIEAVYTQTTPGGGGSETYDNFRIEMQSAVAKSGDEVVLALEIYNNPGISNIAFDVIFDSEVFELVNVYDTALFGSKGMMSADYTGGTHSYLWSNSTGESSANGTVAEYNFRVKDGAASGDYVIAIDFDANDIFDFDLDTVCLEAINGMIIVEASEVPEPVYLTGDVTGDKVVNLLDLLRLGKHLSGWEVVISESASDVTGDGIINRLDLLRLGKYLSGWEVELG